MVFLYKLLRKLMLIQLGLAVHIRLFSPSDFQAFTCN